MKIAMWVTETCRRYMECIILSHTLMGNCWFWHHTEMYLVFSHSYKLAVIWSIHVYFSNITWVKKCKVKCILVQALRLCTDRTAHRGSRGIALLFHDHSTRRGWGVSVMPRPLFTPTKDLVPTVQEAGWTPGPVWTGGENFAPIGIRSPDCPAHSQSLYQLRYPAQKV